MKKKVKRKYSIEEIAYFYVNFAFTINEKIDINKLNFLCYYAYAWYIVLNNENDENIVNFLLKTDYYVGNFVPINHEFNALVIAKWFLEKEKMTLKKLNKLCYYAQGWHAALMTDQETENIFPLAKTTFEAWVHGPVSPIIYTYFKFNSNYKAEPGVLLTPDLIKEDVILEQEDEELLERVWDTYGDQSGFALEILSHSELPWKKARNGIPLNQKSTNVISLQDMHNFYLSIYDNGEE